MSKQIDSNKEIYLAPGMVGKYEEGIPVVIYEKITTIHETLDPDNLDHKIRIYEREVKGWFLEPAKKLSGNHRNRFDNGLIIIMICMAYMEGVQQYREGKSSQNQSCQFFIDSFKRLYPESQNEHITELYKKIRCGLFHNGMVSDGVIFNYDFSQSIKFEADGRKININPKRLLDEVENDFDRYISELKNPDNTSLRENFNRMFTVLPDKKEEGKPGD